MSSYKNVELEIEGIASLTFFCPIMVRETVPWAQFLTYRWRNVSREDLFSLPDGQLRPELQVEVRELDVVGVVVASVVDEAVDGVDDDPGDALVAVWLHLHAVGA